MSTTIQFFNLLSWVTILLSVIYTGLVVWANHDDPRVKWSLLMGYNPYVIALRYPVLLSTIATIWLYCN